MLVKTAFLEQFIIKMIGTNRPTHIYISSYTALKSYITMMGNLKVISRQLISININRRVLCIYSLYKHLM